MLEDGLKSEVRKRPSEAPWKSKFSRHSLEAEEEKNSQWDLKVSQSLQKEQKSNVEVEAGEPEVFNDSELLACLEVDSVVDEPNSQKEERKSDIQELQEENQRQSDQQIKSIHKR